MLSLCKFFYAVSSGIDEVISVMMMMMMMNCFRGIIDQQKVFSLISTWGHCQRSSPSQISDTPWVGFEPCAEAEFRVGNCNSDNHYTAAPTHVLMCLSLETLTNIIHKDWLTYSGGADRPGELCYNLKWSHSVG